MELIAFRKLILKGHVIKFGVISSYPIEAFMAVYPELMIK